MRGATEVQLQRGLQAQLQRGLRERGRRTSRQLRAAVPAGVCAWQVRGAQSLRLRGGPRAGQLLQWPSPQCYRSICLPAHLLAGLRLRTLHSARDLRVSAWL
ncbi:nimC2 [Drosophila busckii]|uniref:NimC2 n=1 Tax=Drosophila busckii TaxID=30019 RepID=A0A0M4ECZ6_DROBS|nr:nimC2 [Drosophila busckii]